MKLTFSCQGSPQGYPVFYLHGTPGSALEPRLPDSLQQQIYLIAVDRPGYGDTPYQPHYPYTEFTQDLEQLAKQLGVLEASVFGFSGGGTYALAAAAQLPHLIQRLAIASSAAGPLLDNPLQGAGDLSGPIWAQARDTPEQLSASLPALLPDAASLYQLMTGSLSQDDQALFGQPELAEHYLKALDSALKAGPSTLAACITRELHQVLHPWDFDPASIQQPVELFHGGTDGLLSEIHTVTLESRLANARLHFVEQAGHYAGIYNPEIFTRLLTRLLPATKASEQ